MFFNYLFALLCFIFCYCHLLQSQKIVDDVIFTSYLSKKSEFEDDLLQPQCTLLEPEEAEKIEANGIDRKDFFMFDYFVVKNKKILQDVDLEIYSSTGNSTVSIGATKNESSIILIFYIGNFDLAYGEVIPYTATLRLQKIANDKQNEFNCTNYGYQIYVLKYSHIKSTNDIVYLEGPINFVMGKTPGEFLIGITPFFKSGKWKQHAEDKKIAFHIIPLDKCYTQLERRFNKPVLMLQKIIDMYGPWSEWSECTMTCEHKDNVRIRTRTCISPKNDCLDSNLEESEPCPNFGLPRCVSDANKHSRLYLSTITIVLMVILPLVIVSFILFVLYQLYFKRSGTDMELYQDVANRYFYD